MQVRLNALALRPDGAGVSTYIRELLRAFPAAWQAACTAQVQSDAVGDLPRLVERSPVTPRAGARRALAGMVPGSRPGQVLHGLDVDLPYGHRGPTACTVHDLSVFDVPWAFPRLRVRGERALVAHALRRADVVLAVSSFTAERVKTLFGRDSVVTPLAPGSDLLPAGPGEAARVRLRYDLPDRFVLHVGSIEPRKDVPRLVDACRRLDLPLVLAGGGGAAYVSTGVRRLGYVPRQDLPALYRAATVTAYVSLYEGFGLPPVEALACGGRVVATRVADLPVLLGDAVTWAASCDVEALTDALRAAASGEEVAPAPELSWEPAASRTVDVYRQLGAEPLQGFALAHPGGSA
jgi:glycosyltransferase involved in cell wall biosynthesis